MATRIIADAATTWTAIGAIGSMMAALTAVVIAFTLNRKQTNLTERAAGNARVSADAAVSATRVACDALEVATGQLLVAREEVQVARDSARAAWESVHAADRPHFGIPALEWHEAARRLVVLAENIGNGPGSLRRVEVRGPGTPPGFVTIEGAPSEPALVGQRAACTVSVPPGLATPGAGPFEVEAEVVNVAGEDARLVRWTVEAVTIV